MVHAEPPNRSRIAWPHREPPEPPTLPVVIADKRKTHRRQWAAIVVLYLVVALNSYLVVINYQYMLGRGEYRDQEQARLQQQTTEQIRVAICGMLDGLPTGPVLDPLRVRYECEPGNGIPPEELSPEARQDLQNYRQGPLTTNNDLARDDGRASPNPRFSAGSTGQPRQTPAETTDAPTPTPTVAPPAVASDDPATAPPLIDLNPVTDPVCALLGVCL